MKREIVKRLYDCWCGFLRLWESKLRGGVRALIEASAAEKILLSVRFVKVQLGSFIYLGCTGAARASDERVPPTDTSRKSARSHGLFGRTSGFSPRFPRKTHALSRYLERAIYRRCIERVTCSGGGDGTMSQFESQ